MYLLGCSLLAQKDADAGLQTLSRIANWENMAPIEKERTLRVLVARNK